MGTILEGKLYLSRAIFKRHYITDSLFCVVLGLGLLGCLISILLEPM